MPYLIKAISVLFTVYSVMLLVRILSSWIPEVSHWKILQFVRFYTDPYLNFFRKFIPPLGMFDISPIFAFIALQILEHIVITIIT